MMNYTQELDQECGQGPERCEGEVFARTSHSGLTGEHIREL